MHVLDTNKHSMLLYSRQAQDPGAALICPHQAKMCPEYIPAVMSMI